MKSSNNTLSEEFERVKARLVLVEKEKAQLASDIDFYKERLQVLERNFDSNKHVIQRLNQEKDEEING